MTVTEQTHDTDVRPCRYCTAAHTPYEDAEMCEMTHQRPAEVIAPLATKMARSFQAIRPTDEQIGWFMQDADEVIQDFDPIPEKWSLRKLPAGEGSISRFRLNGHTYVVEDGEGYISPVRLSTLRQWKKEAERG